MLRNCVITFCPQIIITQILDSAWANCEANAGKARILHICSEPWLGISQAIKKVSSPGSYSYKLLGHHWLGVVHITPQTAMQVMPATGSLTPVMPAMASYSTLFQKSFVFMCIYIWIDCCDQGHGHGGLRQSMIAGGPPASSCSYMNDWGSWWCHSQPDSHRTVILDRQYDEICQIYTHVNQFNDYVRMLNVDLLIHLLCAHRGTATQMNLSQMTEVCFLLLLWRAVHLCCCTQSPTYLASCTCSSYISSLLCTVVSSEMTGFACTQYRQGRAQIQHNI